MRGRHGPATPRRAGPDLAAPRGKDAPAPVPADLTHAPSVGRLLSHHGIWLTKSLGQHLLVDRGVLQRIVDAAHLHDDLEVLEIGPGVGVLTAELVKRARRVVSVEIDPRMAAVLRATVPHAALEIVEADAMAIDPAALFGGRPYVVVANLPYHVATAVIRRLVALPAPARPVELVVMVQREVARRMAASPGDLTALGVEVQVAAAAQVLFDVPPEAFFPAPKVTSAVLRLRPHAAPAVPLVPTPARFGQLVRAGFAQRRKQLHNALGALGVGVPRIDAALAAAGIARSRRAETLTLDEWSRLSADIWDSAAGDEDGPDRLTSQLPSPPPAPPGQGCPGSGREGWGGSAGPRDGEAGGDDR